MPQIIINEIPSLRISKNVDKTIASLKQTPLNATDVSSDFQRTKAQKTFSSVSNDMNMPRPKTLFWVYFKLNNEISKMIKFKNNQLNDYSYEILSEDNLSKLSFELSKIVKYYDKPSISFDTTELNSYNRKKIIYKDIKYNSITIKFFDIKENPVQEFFNSYLKIISGNFFGKSNNNYLNFMPNDEWIDGSDIEYNFGLNLDSNFKLIESISFCEYFMNKLTITTITNPTIKKITYGNSELSDYKSNDIEITFDYDGITHDIVIDDINSGYRDDTSKNVINKTFSDDMAKFMQLRIKKSGNNYTEETRLSNNLYSAGVDPVYSDKINSGIAEEYKIEMYKINKYSDKKKGQIIGDAWSILKAYLNKDVDYGWNTVKKQILDTARKYGLAEQANAYEQALLIKDNVSSKNFTENIIYGINMIKDPTTVVGEVTTNVSNISTGFVKTVGGWFL